MVKLENKNTVEKIEEKLKDITNSDKINAITIKMSQEIEGFEKQHPEMKKICAYYVLQNTKGGIKYDLVSIIAIVVGLFISAGAFMIGAALIMFGVTITILRLQKNSKYQKHLIETYFK